MAGDLIGTAIGAGIGALGGGKGGGGGSTSKPTIPPWLAQDWKDLVEKAQTYSDKPFEPFTGEAVAPLSTDESTAFQNLRNLMGQANPIYGQAQGTLADVLGRAINGPTSSQIQGLMNPYIQQVIEDNKLNMLQDFDTQRERIFSDAVKADAFGGDRRYIQEAMLRKNLTQQLGQMEHAGLADAFDKALGQFNLGTNIMGSTALSQAGLANQQQQLGMTEAGALANAGATQRGINQAQDTFDYNEFMRKIQDPQTKMTFLSNILGQASPSFTGQAVSLQNPTPNPLNSILGGAMAGSQLFSGLFNSGGASSAIGGGLSGALGGSSGGGFLGNLFGSIFGHKEGGLVKGYANGGLVSPEEDDMDSIAQEFNKIEPGTPLDNFNPIANIEQRLSTLTLSQPEGNLYIKAKANELTNRLANNGNGPAELAKINHELKMLEAMSYQNMPAYIDEEKKFGPGYAMGGKIMPVINPGMPMSGRDRAFMRHMGMQGPLGAVNPNVTPIPMPGWGNINLSPMAYASGGMVKSCGTYAGGGLIDILKESLAINPLTQPLQSLWNPTGYDETQIQPPAEDVTDQINAPAPKDMLNPSSLEILGRPPGNLSMSTFAGLDPETLAQISKESGWNPNAVGSAGEIGLGQIKPSTAARPGFGLPSLDISSPSSNAKSTQMYRNALENYYDGKKGPNGESSKKLALMAYNQGAGTVDDYIQSGKVTNKIQFANNYANDILNLEASGKPVHVGGVGGSSNRRSMADLERLNPTEIATTNDTKSASSILDRIIKDSLGEYDKKPSGIMAKMNDPWVAMGLAMMGSKSPSLGGALSEGYQAYQGAQQLSQATKQQKMQDLMGLLKLRESVDAGNLKDSLINAQIENYKSLAKTRGTAGGIKPATGSNINSMKMRIYTQKMKELHDQNVLTPFTPEEYAQKEQEIIDGINSTFEKITSEGSPESQAPQGGGTGLTQAQAKGTNGKPIPVAAVQALKQHPEKADEFDAHFGAGSAAKILGQ